MGLVVEGTGTEATNAKPSLEPGFLSSSVSATMSSWGNDMRTYIVVARNVNLSSCEPYQVALYYGVLSNCSSCATLLAHSRRLAYLLKLRRLLGGPGYL